jgi:ADP-ribosylglycohydrolase
MEQRNGMMGAIIGDIAGSVYEYRNCKSVECELFSSAATFTDDSVLTVATADVLLYGGSYTDAYQHYGCRFPDAGYGAHFHFWIFSENPAPYNSWGNGSAMRVSPIGLALNSLKEVLDEAERSAAVTHDHPEGIKGAQAVAAAVFLARRGETKAFIRDYVAQQFGYSLDRMLNDIRPAYSYDVSCQGSVPEAIIAFLESIDFEDALRKAISIGGDSDTIACITGSIAHAFYRVLPQQHVRSARRILSRDLLEVVDEFSDKYPISGK